MLFLLTVMESVNAAPIVSLSLGSYHARIMAEPGFLTVTDIVFETLYDSVTSGTSSTLGSLLYQYQSPSLVVTTLPPSFTAAVRAKLLSP